MKSIPVNIGNCLTAQSIIIQLSIHLIFDTSQIRKSKSYFTTQYYLYALVHITCTVSFSRKKKKDYLAVILPCIYQTVSTPLDTGHSIGVACKGNNTLPRGYVPNTRITIFTCTYETAGRRLQMNWLPGYSSNPLSVSLL
jgi:hypothetical protein